MLGTLLLQVYCNMAVIEQSRKNRLTVKEEPDLRFLYALQLFFLTTCYAELKEATIQILDASMEQFFPSLQQKNIRED
jgi:hypothetical protein